ncbi:hypothetical protein [Fodinicola acaciae]|uniref:hypothetical protein n=1 Tax=Fodinicola acaciae TaxID=2681555 RepID=UPI003CCCA960
MRASLAVSALRNAIALRDPRGVVVRSDWGALFRSAAHRRLLRAHGLAGSMGQVGAGGVLDRDEVPSQTPATPPGQAHGVNRSLGRPVTAMTVIAAKAGRLPAQPLQHATLDGRDHPTTRLFLVSAFWLLRRGASMCVVGWWSTCSVQPYRW